jgi:hypothetical protein
MGNIIPVQTLKFYILDKQKADELLTIAEQHDMYVEECMDDESNAIARRNCTYAPNRIGLQEKTYALNFFENIRIPQRLISDIGYVNIIHLMPSAEGGMPHTRPGNIICYPILSNMYSQSTLIHELWHIHQRHYKAEWIRVFEKLGWKQWGGQLPETLEKYRRYNPDTIDCPLWIFQDNWVPVPIFKDITHPNINDVDIWFYSPQKRTHIKQVPDELRNYCGGLPLSAYEHPRELTAYMLADPEKYKGNIGFQHLIEAIGHTAIS